MRKILFVIVMLVAKGVWAEGLGNETRISYDNIDAYRHKLSQGQLQYLDLNREKYFVISENKLFSPIVNQSFVPYKKPSSGEEVMWNHLKRYRGVSLKRAENEEVHLTGQEVSSKVMVEENEYHYKDANKYHMSMWNITEPQSRRREVVLRHHYVVQEGVEVDGSWQYLPSTRRVRRAPQISYDYILAGKEPGSETDDKTTRKVVVKTVDSHDMFNGPLDKYKWNILEDREIYIPVTKIYPDDGADAKYDLKVNLKRVLVVQGVLKEGQEHIFGKRKYYIEPDTWQIIMGEAYKKSEDDKVEIFSMAEPLFFPERSAVLTNHELHANLVTGDHAYYFYSAYEIWDEVAFTDRYFSTVTMRRVCHR